jgi:pyrroloquinoline-quinone synthase
MNVFARIDQARRECNVLEHPFYQRWSAGTLTERELDVYAGQYRHAVLALAEASSRAAAKAASDTSSAEHAEGLERHAAEEAAHVALWDRFAQAVGGDAGRDEDEAFEQTQRCADSWIAGEDVLEHLAVLYAIEASQPEISKAKLEGLVERYGYSEEGPATEYFRLHATLDVEHARQARELIERLMSGGDAQAQSQAAADRMVERTEAALRGNWALLDGVEANREQSSR